MDIISSIKKLKIGTVLENVDLVKYNTYKISANALGIAFPKDVDSLKKLLDFLKENNIKHKILGNGSNLVFSKFYDGILIKLDCFDKVKIEGTTIKVGAGYNLVKLAFKAARESLTGLEFASGIPGTIGGAIYMNAGAYKSDMGYIVKDVTILTPENEIKVLNNKEMEFHYRTSYLQKNPGNICLETTLVLTNGRKEAILEVIADRKQRRLESQPLEFPSAGSVFRNPENDYAGRLVEELGYKGKRMGDAKVSDKHANFIINVGKATGEDVKKLILEIQSEVEKKYGVTLKIEQEFVD